MPSFFEIGQPVPEKIIQPVPEKKVIQEFLPYMGMAAILVI